MPQQMDAFLQLAPHSLAVVLSHEDELRGRQLVLDQRLQEHRLGYEIFANFKEENMQHFWNKRVTEAIAETFFLGWIDEHVLLIQGKEQHLGALREGWVRRALRPPQGFHIKYLVYGEPVSLWGYYPDDTGEGPSGHWEREREKFRAAADYGTIVKSVKLTAPEENTKGL